MNVFGQDFQAYVERLLKYSGRELLSTSELETRAAAALGAKSVDFAILEKNAGVLIDAKGVEFGHQGMTTHRPNVISGQVKASILKGISQAMATRAALEFSGRGQRDWYVLIVTFKDPFLGTGEDLARIVPPERLESVLGSPIEDSAIPLKHMYFVSLHEFELLVEVLRTVPESCGEIMRRVVERDAEKKQLVLAQHLDLDYPNSGAPDFLVAEFKMLMLRALQRMVPR